MTTQTQAAHPPKHTALVVAMIGLLAAVGGTWGAWRWWQSPGAGEQIVDIPMSGIDAAAMGARQRNMPRPDGVRATGGSYTVKSGDAMMRASKSSKGEWSYGFWYDSADFTPPDQAALFTARYQSRSLDLSVDQIKQLEAIPQRGGMAVSNDDREKLANLFQKYLASDASGKPSAEEALIAALGEVSQRSLDPTRAEMSARADKIRSILTPDQLAKLKAR
ncbi:MAG: hypothetical protein ACREJC_19240 [Tepidisphaeraceae bacterium]